MKVGVLHTHLQLDVLWLSPNQAHFGGISAIMVVERLKRGAYVQMDSGM